MAGFASVLSLPLHAQQLQSEQVPPEYVFEVRTAERWMHDGQRPRFTPHHTHTEWLTVDSLRMIEPGVRLMFVSSRVSPARGRGWVQFGSDGVQDVHFAFEPRQELREVPADVQARRERNRLFSSFVGDDYLRLPQFSLGRLIPSFQPGRTAVGESWSDTIRIAEERDGFEQALEGRRFSRIVRDTIAGGRRLLIVRDSAFVQYHERWMRQERTLDTLVVVERNATGVVTGRYLHDPGVGLARFREDSTRLTGTAVLRYPDGRSFRTPARYDATRRIDLFEPDEYLKRREALNAARAARRGGMLVQPSTPIEERLTAGDTVLRDSLLDVLRTTEDGDERQRTWQWLRRWWRPGDADFAERIDLAAGADADTSYLIRELQRSFYRGARHQFDEATLRRALPFMADPGIAFRFNAPQDPFYENPRQALLLHPPVAAEDTTRWACTPAACGLLAQQIDAGGDPRLQALGLIAAFVLEPGRYSDEVVRRASAGEPLLLPAAALARGEVGRASLDPAAITLPAPDAGWREWLLWMDPYSVGLDEPPQLRFDESHHAAVRVRESITGRDVAEELARRRAVEVNDSALLVIDYLLTRLGAVRPGVEEVATLLQSDSEPERARGRIALPYLFADAHALAQDTAAELINRLLGTLIDGEESWPMLPDIREQLRPRRLGGWDHRPEAAVFLLRDGLPQAVIEAWEGRAQAVTREEWSARSPREAGIILSVDEPRQVGPFVRISADYRSQYERLPHEAPEGYAGGVTVTLMQTPAGWVIVAAGGWVT